MDMPPIEIIQIDSHDPVGPFGAKESGEGTAAPTAAYANHYAPGVWIKGLPVTPGRLLRAMEERNNLFRKE